MASLAQEETWTLERCIQYANDNNLQIQQAKLGLDQQSINVDQAKMARMPNLSGSAGYQFSVGYSIDPFTNSFQSQSIHSSNFGLNSSTVLFSGFQLQNRIKQSELDLTAFEYDIADAQNNLALNITLAYLRVLFGREFIEGAKAQISSTEEQLTRTNRLIQAGILPAARVYDIEAQLATDNLNLVNAQNQEKLAYLDIMQLLQLEPEEKFRVAIPEIPSEISPPSVPNTIEVYDIAVANQPNIMGGNVRIRSAQVGMDMAKGARMPSVFLSLGANTGYSNLRFRQEVNDTLFLAGFLASDPNTPFFIPQTLGSAKRIPFFNQLGQNFGQQVSLGINIPIYSRKTLLANIERADLNIKNARYNAEIQKQSLRQTIEKAYLDVTSAYSQYTAVKKQIEALEVTYRNSQKQFDLGVMNATDLFVTKNNLNRARYDLVRAKYDYIFKTKILDFYRGKSLKF